MAFLTGQRLSADLLNQNLQGVTTAVVTDSAAISAETVGITVVIAVTAGQTYGITVKATIGSSAVGTLGTNLAIVRIREDSVSGNQLSQDVFTPLTSASAGFAYSTYTEYTAASTTTKTIVFTFARNTATTETYIIRAAANRPTFMRVQPLVN